MDEALLKQLKQKVEEELRQREMALLEFWLKELKAIDAKRHRDLAGLQTDVKSFIARMETRLRSVKGGGR
jgi:predicted component of type VI protein secretion system